MRVCSDTHSWWRMHAFISFLHLYFAFLCSMNKLRCKINWWIKLHCELTCMSLRVWCIQMYFQIIQFRIKSHEGAVFLYLCWRCWVMLLLSTEKEKMGQDLVICAWRTHSIHTKGWPVVGAVVQQIRQSNSSGSAQADLENLKKKGQCVGVKASVLFPFAVQTVYSMHLVHTNLHCCTIRLCNEAGRNCSK